MLNLFRNRACHSAVARWTALIGAASAALPLWAASPLDLVPSATDEAAAYTDWGWTWATEAAQPQWEFDPQIETEGFSVVDPGVHSDTEGDDLWTYVAMYHRTGNEGYRHRADGWLRYFKDDYVQCIGQGDTFCSDRSFGLDHAVGWGLIAHYELTGETASLAAAESIGAEINDLWLNHYGQGVFPTPGNFAMSAYGPRGPARHLILASRLAEATGKSEWIALRDRLMALWLQSPDWDEAEGMYFVNAFTTSVMQGDYAAGDRLQFPFQLGILAEAFWQAYRTTGEPELRSRLIEMARFVEEHGIDPATDYTANFSGVNGGQSVFIYKSITPAYATSLVNLLVMGYKLSGDPQLYERAKHHFNRGTKGVFGNATARTAPDDVAEHFVDTRFIPNGDFLTNNRGELQYTYLLFENGGAPVVEGVRPSPPTNLRVE